MLHDHFDEQLLQETSVPSAGTTLSEEASKAFEHDLSNFEVAMRRVEFLNHRNFARLLVEKDEAAMSNFDRLAEMCAELTTKYGHDKAALVRIDQMVDRNVAEPTRSHFKRRAAALVNAKLDEVDAQLGDLLAKLKEAGMDPG